MSELLLRTKLTPPLVPQVLLASPRLPPAETILTTLINEISLLGMRLILVVDDFHVIQLQPIHQQMGFLVEH